MQDIIRKAIILLTACLLISCTKPEDVDIDDPKLHLNMGFEYQRLGRFKEADAEFKRAIELDNKTAGAYRGIGIIKEAEGDIKTAEGFYKKAVELDPRDIASYNSIAVIYSKTNRVEEAVEILKKAIRIHPSSDYTHNNLGLIYLSNNRLDDARLEFLEALRLNPKLVFSRNSLGMIYLRENKLDTAEQEFREALKYLPNFQPALSNLANVYQLKGEYDSAIKLLERLIGINPKRINDLYALANLYNVTKQYDRALIYYEKAIKEDKGFALAYNNAAYLYTRLEKELDKAEDYAKKAILYNKRQEYEPVYRDTLGWVLYKHGRYKDASGELIKALGLVLDNRKGLEASIRYHLGMTYLKMGRLSEAALSIKQAIDTGSLEEEDKITAYSAIKKLSGKVKSI